MSSHWLHWKAKSSLCALAVFKHQIHLVTFLYIFLLVDCFKWALIDHKIHLVTFLYIFLLVDFFKWALIDHTEKQRVHSELWQFQTSDSPGDISLYLPISWLFQMSSHWLHWKAKSSLWTLPISNWGVYRKIHLVTFLYIFLLVDCFKWALIDGIEKQRVHSAALAVSNIRFTWCHFFISSY